MKRRLLIISGLMVFFVLGVMLLKVPHVAAEIICYEDYTDGSGTDHPQFLTKVNPCDGFGDAPISSLNIPNYHLIAQAPPPDGLGHDLQDGYCYTIHNGIAGIQENPINPTGNITVCKAEAEAAQRTSSPTPSPSNPAPTPTPAPSGGGGGGGGSSGSNNSLHNNTIATGQAPHANTPSAAAPICDYSKPLTDEEKKNGCIDRCPDNASGQSGCGFETTDSKCDPNNNGGKNCQLYDGFNTIANVLAAGVAVVVTVMIILAGIQYSTSGGDPAKAAAAKSRIIKALIALLAFFLIYALLQWLVPGGIF